MPVTLPTPTTTPPCRVDETSSLTTRSSDAQVWWMRDTDCQISPVCIRLTNKSFNHRGLSQNPPTATSCIVATLQALLSSTPSIIRTPNALSRSRWVDAWWTTMKPFTRKGQIATHSTKQLTREVTSFARLSRQCRWTDLVSGASLVIGDHLKPKNMRKTSARPATRKTKSSSEEAASPSTTERRCLYICLLK